MNEPLRRMRLGAVILGVVFVAAVCGYRLLGREWNDAFYMVVITVSSVGYGEHSSLSPGEKLFTALVIVLGITTVAFTFGSFIQMMTQGEIIKALGLRRMTKSIEQLQNHVVICGFGRMGQILSEEMHRRKTPFVLIDKDPQKIVEAHSFGFLALTGDATEEEILNSAGVRRAKTLVAALPTDADNVFISLTSRNLHPKLQIISAAAHRSTQKKLIQAGADRVILPATIGAQRIAAMITHPSTVELMELVANHSVMDVELDELTVPAGSPLIGKSLLEVETRRKHGLLIVAVKKEVGNMIFNPGRDFVFSAQDTVIFMGRTEDIERFRREFGL